MREPALFTTPSGTEIEYLCTGSGEPVTVFAHGLGSGIEETRPLGSAVPGSRVFFHFRGHGRSTAPAGTWSYADLATDLLAVADRFDASRALGASLGAGALCRLLADRPDRFERLVFFLPAVLDEPRPEVSQRQLRERIPEPALATLPEQVALANRAVLAAVTAPALVIGCRDDELHPATVAEDLASALPHAALHVYDQLAPILTARADLRLRVSGFLGG